MALNLWMVVAAMVVGVIFLVFEKLQPRKSTTELPPGPRKLPIIGNLHQNLRQLGGGGELIHIALFKLSQQYGQIMTVWFGRKPTIVVSGHEGAWEVLVNKAADYASRNLPYMARLVTADWRTLSSADSGPYWLSLRKGVQGSALNPLAISMQTQSQEHNVIDMTHRIDADASSNDGIVRPLVHIRRTTVRIAARLCFGHDFDNERFVAAMDTVVEDVIKVTGLARLIDAFPFVRHIPGLSLPFKQALEVNHRIVGLIDPQISLYQSSSSPSTNCYLHFLLSQGYPKEVVIFNLFEMFLLSVDSTSSATAWALAFLIRNPQVQEKLYKEVSGGDENGEKVSIDQVSQMPYLQAVVKEVIRMKPIAPLAVPHKAMKDTTLLGKKVDEGTSVIVNLYAVLHDPAVWDDANRFMPERFLGQHVRDSDAAMATERSFLPFGAGRRICAGMELGKIQVALNLANLVKRFEWRAAAGDGPDMSEDLTAVLRMKNPLVARVQPRPGFLRTRA